MTRQLKAGTRRSRLAIIQTEEVIQRLASARPDLDIAIETLTTVGDQTTGSLKGQDPGVFTNALEEALLNKQIDFAVHSLKDLPVQLPEELMIAAVPERHVAFDALVTDSGLTLDELPEGATVGTSSLRRTLQLRVVRPDLNIVPLRGNVDTRVQKILKGELQAAVLAESGLARLGIDSRYLRRIPMDTMLPAPAQGALAVECRKDDEFAASILQAITCQTTRTATIAERSFLASIGKGCAAPIAAYAELAGEQIHMRVQVLSRKGRGQFSRSLTGSDPLALAQRLAEEADHMRNRWVHNSQLESA